MSSSGPAQNANKPSFSWLTLVVSADKLSIKARGHPPKGAALPSVADVEVLFEALHVKVAPDVAAMRVLVSQLARGRDAADMILAKATPPEAGADGYVDMGEETRAETGEERVNGSLDYREQSTIRTVRAGQIVARIHPPGDGSPGEDVFGTPLAAIRGTPATLALGENVRAAAEGYDIFATIDGAVSVSGAALSVKDTFVVRGDVDFATGNVHLDHGTVLVEGDIKPGFSVTAEDDIQIRGASDSARIVSGADVRIGRGVFGGHVRAGGDAVLRFAQNVFIEADGDVLVGGGLVNCEVFAGGRVLCQSGKGQIRGGAIRATHGIDVKDLGSDSHVRTVVELVAPHKVMIDLTTRLRGEEEALASLSKHLGNASDAEILSRAAVEDRDQLEPLLVRRRALIRRISKLRKAIDGEQRAVRHQSEARIRVFGTVHSGVVVTIGGVPYDVKDTARRVQFLYDGELHKVRMLPL